MSKVFCKNTNELKQIRITTVAANNLLKKHKPNIEFLSDLTDNHIRDKIVIIIEDTRDEPGFI